MEKTAFILWAKAQYAKQQAKDKAKALKNAFLEEDGGSEGVIIAIIMIIIVVGLGIIFRDKIGEWIGALFGQADSQISNDFTPSVST